MGNVKNNKVAKWLASSSLPFASRVKEPTRVSGSVCARQWAEENQTAFADYNARIERCGEFSNGLRRF